MPPKETVVHTIDIVHEHVHDGVTFQASYKSPEGADIADNGNITFAIFTGRNISHLVFECSAGGDSEVAFYRGASLSANGTNMNAINMEQDRSIFTPSTAMTHTPSITTNGVLLHNSLLAGGIGGPQSTGGTIRQNTEWNLKRNSIYLLQFINRSGSSQPMSVIVQWYELGYEA